MKKKLFCLLLTLLMLLCACTGEGGATEPPATDPGGTATDPSYTPLQPGQNLDTWGDLLTEEEFQEYKKQALEEAIQVPPYTGRLQFPADPDRKVCIAGFANQERDFYSTTMHILGDGTVFSGSTCSGYILSKEPCSVDQIRVSLDTQTAYQVNVEDMTQSCWVKDEYANIDTTYFYGLNLSHYMSLQGVDWQWLSQEYQTMVAAQKLWSKMPYTSREYKAYARIDDEYKALIKGYADQYAQQPLEEMVPRLYVYRVDIHFTGTLPMEKPEDTGEAGETVGVSDGGGQVEYVEIFKRPVEFADETVQTLEFRVGEDTYPVEVGQWRFHQQVDPDAGKEQQTPGLDGVRAGGGIDDVSSPVNPEGYGRISAFGFIAAETVVLVGLTKPAELNCLGAHVQYLDGQGTVASDLYWDMQQPLKIDPGQRVAIDVIVKDGRLARHEMLESVEFILDYEVNGKLCSLTANSSLSRTLGIWDCYLMAFAGCDTGGYYACYLAPMRFANLPEEWLQ